MHNSKVSIVDVEQVNTSWNNFTKKIFHEYFSKSFVDFVKHLPSWFLFVQIKQQ